MMSKPSRLARPLSANSASRLPSCRKEDYSSRMRKTSLGEKILRAGSEGNLNKKQSQQQQQVQKTEALLLRRVPVGKDQGKSNLRGISLDDADCLWPKELIASGNSQTSVSKAGRNIPRRHTVGGPRSSKEILGMQASEMDKKREAFLEHLKQKYPHHATAIMGHQERLRDQTRSPKLSQSPQPNLGDQAEYLSEASADSLEIMSEGEPLSPFSRGSRTRASLPVVRTTNQTKERSLGALYLQYGDETKQLRMPNEITSTDTIRALFVSAFPQQLSMKILESPSVAIYIKDESRNIYYELSDVRNIQDRSFLKVYNKDPAHAFNHMPRAVNGDIRMQRDIYSSASRPGSATHHPPPPPHALPTSPPATPVPHSMPPSPSRIPYSNVRPVSGPGNATIPRDRLSNMPASRSISPSPSAILERRDVKPDEDMGNKTLTLYRNEGLYADPYLYHDGRMSIAGSHTGHPLDIPDHVIAYHRSTMRSSSTYCNPPMQPEIMEQSLYRQKSRKYADSHLPTLSSKTPPTSPHRVAEMRMIDIHTHHNTPMSPHAIHLDRSSPGRQSLKKDPGTPVFMEGKPRNVMGLHGMTEVVPSVPDKKAFGYGTVVIPKETETRERMHAMEKQIASLTGLVQSALLKGPNTSNSKDAPSEKIVKTVSSKSNIERTGSAHVSGGKNSLAASEAAVATAANISHSMPVGCTAMQVSLFDMKRNVSDLRLQLHQMRQLQLQNQETLRAMVKKAELEINDKVIERAKKLEDPVQRQRHLVEQERQKYLLEEERIVKSLCELESFVEDLKKETMTTSRIVTLKDVEDGACLLRQVGEAVANLKGEFPTLQNKMRAILRIEVEAVRFLKEEPHKLDILLKRVRSMTDTLTTLRRHVTDDLLKGVDPSQAAQYNAMEKVTAVEVLKSHEETGKIHTSPLKNVAESPAEPPVKSEVMPVSTVTVHHVQSSPVVIHQSQHSSTLVNQAPNSPLTTSPTVASPGLNRTTSAVSESTTVTTTVVQPMQAPLSPQVSVNGSTMQSLFIEELHNATTRNRALSIEKAEKKWEEKRQNRDHYNGKEFEKLLEEAQANIMKSIPNLEMPPQATSPKVNVVEKEVTVETLNPELDTEKPVKSPPPPPPRRSYLVGSGLSTRLGEISYVTRKDNIVAKESSEDSSSPATQPKVPKEDSASPQSLGTVAPAKDDDDEEEGDRIMAELQVFQKCTYMDVNSNSHVEQSRNDTHTKDARPVALIQSKEKKVYGEATKDSDHPQDKHEERTGEMASDVSSPIKHSAFSRYLILEEKDYASKPFLKINTNLSSELENERKHRPDEAQHPAIENGRQKLSCVVSESDHGASQNEFLEADGTQLVGQINSPAKEISLAHQSPHEQEMPASGYNQVVLRHKLSRNTTLNNIDELESPTSSPSEENLQSENIAFMITKTAVQALSSGEVHDIVNSKGEEVQTVNIDSKKEMATQQDTSESLEGEEPVVCLDKKPVIIIFDEPMDIRSAYKRLSTIFEECDEELEKMMTGDKIDEEEEDIEESDITDAHDTKVYQKDSNRRHATEYTANHRCEHQFGLHSPSDSPPQVTFPEGQEIDNMELGNSSYIYGPHPEPKLDVPDAKKKFKFKFPKKQLAALTQAIRTGTKTGKKTLQVVVYEEEEEDGTLKEHKEAKRFEIPSSQPENPPRKQEPNVTVQISRTDEIRKNTYKTLDSLEQTIKQLESTISEMSPKPASEASDRLERTPAAGFFSSKEPIVLEESNADVESPSSLSSTSHKASPSTSQTSRMPIPAATKSRPPGSVDKTSKPHKLQDQRQYRQANGSAKKAGGDYKATSPTLSASKIPAFSSTSGKGSSVSSGDSTNLPSPPTKASVPPSNPLSPQTGRPTHSASFIPSVSNGSLKFQNPTHTGKGHHLSFSIQTQNGRPNPLPPSPFSSPSFSSPTSPTSLNQGVKSIRSIHTPSFTSYKSQNGSVSKSTPSSTITKEPS
uniref:KIAA1217 n=1 Tax=Anolis carolinensis TaxID=28377 RepID=A0A803TUA9_ANOCA